MKTHLRLLLLTLVTAIPTIARAERPERPDPPTNEPVVVAKTETTFIHAFHGLAQQNDRFYRPIHPGIVVMRTDRETGDAKVMLGTGTFSIPTRRISYSISRLLGLYATDTHLAAVVYQSGRIWDRPPREPDPENGSYRLVVYEIESGKSILSQPVALEGDRPKHVPDDTTGLGVIEMTGEGFRVFDTDVHVDTEGAMKIQRREKDESE